jgi:ligand-binding sensor domain-containing protein
VLFEDSRRQLWVGTDQGLFRREPDTGDFRLYKAVPSSLGLYFQDANKVVALGEDRQGRLWVGTRAGLNLLDETSAAFYPTTPLPAERDRIEDEVRHLLGDDKGGLWVATQQNGLFHFDSAAEVLTTYDRKAPASHRIPSNSVRFVYLDEGAYPVIGTATGLSIYDPIGQTLVHHTHMAGDPTG